MINQGMSLNSNNAAPSNTRSCAKMEIIESYGLTLTDISNLVRHAISAADNINPQHITNTNQNPYFYPYNNGVNYT